MNKETAAEKEETRFLRLEGEYKEEVFHCYSHVSLPMSQLDSEKKGLKETEGTEDGDRRG